MTITKRNLLAAAVGAASTRRAAAQDTPRENERPDAGAIAAQVAGRVHVMNDGLLQVLTYFLYVDGLGSDIFSGTPSERNRSRHAAH